ncbi:MAG: serine/threonine protein kinase, partial [Planctomycetota bacterium]
MKTPPIQQKIDNYEILSSLGKGGMGEVYLAKDLVLGRKVAIKFLSPQLSQKKELLERFLTEARASARMDHPNIVSIYTAGQTSYGPYMIMQYVPGKDLRSLLKEQQRFHPKLAVYIALQVAAALNYAHGQGILHRDIKPDNIMVFGKWQVKVMDFGLAKFYQSQSHMTQTGCYLGTPEYSSPEQCETMDIDGRSDLYSLGVVLYEMLSGRVPFRADTPLQLFRKIVEEPLPSLSSLGIYVPPLLEQIVEKLMAKDKRERYQSAEEVIRDLKKVYQEFEKVSSKAPTVEMGPEKVDSTIPSNIDSPSSTFNKSTQDEAIEDAATRISNFSASQVENSHTNLSWKRKGLALSVVILGILLFALISSRFSSSDHKNRKNEKVSHKENKPESEKTEDVKNDNTNPLKQPIHEKKDYRKALVYSSFENPQKNPNLDYLTSAASDILGAKLNENLDIELIPLASFLIKEKTKLALSRKGFLQLLRKAMEKARIPLFLYGKYYQQKDKVCIVVTVYDITKGMMPKYFWTKGKEGEIFELAENLSQKVVDWLLQQPFFQNKNLVALREVKEIKKKSMSYGTPKEEERMMSSQNQGLSRAPQAPRHDFTKGNFSGKIQISETPPDRDMEGVEPEIERGNAIPFSPLLDKLNFCLKGFSRPHLGRIG